MKTIILLFVALCWTNLITAQMNWRLTSDWKLYKVPNSILFRASPDSLAGFKAYPLKRDSMLSFFDQAKLLPKETQAQAWMGGFLATFQYEGKTRKLLLSSYGAYVWDPQDKRYYQLPLDRKDEWWAYIDGCASTL
jgi:hypothetical protein